MLPVSIQQLPEVFQYKPTAADLEALIDRDDFYS